MTTSRFLPAWLTSPADAPEPNRAEAERLAAFADAAVDRAAAVALADASDAGLEALVGLLTQRSDGTRLALMENAPFAKGPRKAVGRAIHALKTRGVACVAPEGLTGGIKYVVELQPSYLGLPMPNGVRFCILSDRVQGEPQVCLAVTHESQGVHELVGMDSTKSRMKRAMEQLEATAREDGFPMLFVEAPRALVRQRIQEGMRTLQASGGRQPDDAHRFELLIGPLSAAPTPHPVRDLLALDASREAEGPDLLGHAHGGGGYHVGIADAAPPADESWAKTQREMILASLGDDPQTPDARSGGLRSRSAQSSRDDIDEEQRKAAVTDEVDRIVNATFDAQRRALDGERLLDTAWVAAKGGLDEVAAIAYATATALLDPSRSAASIPWARHAVLGWLDPNVVDHHADEDAPAE